MLLTILCSIISFCLGGLLAISLIYLVFVGIPFLKLKKWEKFENKVVMVVNDKFGKGMMINKELIKKFMREIEDEQKK